MFVFLKKIHYINIVRVIVFFLLTMLFIEAASSGGCIYTIALTQSESPFYFKDVIWMIRKVKYCECGCGQEARPGNRFINGHSQKGKPSWSKGKKQKEESEKRRKPFVEKYCECGCETLLQHANEGQTFIHGHNRKGKKGAAYWSGKSRSTETNRKVSETLKRKYVSGEIIHPFLGKKHLEKSIEKMKKSHKGQIAWNKDLTKETDDRVRRVSTVLIEGHASGRIKTHPTNKWSNTSIEIAIENELKKVSLKYEKQKHIKGVGFVDFFLPGFDLIIECDGDYWHNLEGRQERDVKRDFGSEFLHQYKTVRFWEHEINESPEKCMRKISKLIKKQGGKI